MSSSLIRCVSLSLLAFAFVIPGCQSSTEEPAPAPEVSKEVPPPKESQTKKTETPKVKKKKPNLKVAPEFAISNPTPILTDEQIADGWIALYDGQTLFGWQSDNKEMNWTVNEGIIEADADGIGVLATTSPFADFELICEFKAEKGGNSGLFLRTAAAPNDPAVDCYELNICDSHEAFKTGSLVKRAQPLTEISGEGDWKTFHAVVKGNHLTAKLDGTPVLDFVDDSENQLAQGYIGLQKNVGKIQFRKVILKPLSSEELFNKQDLSGWHITPGSDSSFEVTDETIAVKGGTDSGRGFLESDQAWRNFVLQLDVKTNGDALNSGIFFRNIKGTAEAPSNGYEMQIQNGFKNDDRTEPADHGTGAIFRRTHARWVNANDREWFTMTLVADGPHFSAWVNGLQVTDWSDTRKADPNPRKGLRLEEGHLSIQGHDPTTDLNFRNLKVAPLAN